MASTPDVDFGEDSGHGAAAAHAASTRSLRVRLEIAGLQRVQDAIDTDKDVTADYVVNDDGGGSDAGILCQPHSAVQEGASTTHSTRTRAPFATYPNKMVLEGLHQELEGHAEGAEAHAAPVCRRGAKVPGTE